MTDQLDKAQELEELFRANAIAHQCNRLVEEPDVDEHGIRYCLGCGIEIPVERLKAMSRAVRCVSCESENE